MPDPIPAVIVRDGLERSLQVLGRGDVIAFREFDTDRGCLVFTVLTPVPPSAEVAGADAWRCEERGHRWSTGARCHECGETYSP